MRRVALPEWPWQVVCALAERHNRQLWLVGGAVRDALLSRPLHDWDFAVDRGALALARATADALGGAYYTLDAERGTGRVLVSDPAGQRLELDFALLRGLHLGADLAARDFTVNAMALDRAGDLIDPTGGLDDLNRGLIRATSDTAFRDDPARLLRALRLQAELSFQIDSHTVGLIRRDAQLVVRPSPERTRDELMRLVGTEGTSAALRTAIDLGLLAPILPEAARMQGVTQSWPHRHDVWTHTLHVLDAFENLQRLAERGDTATLPVADIPQSAWEDLADLLAPFLSRLAPYLSTEVGGGHSRSVLLRLAALLHDTGKPDTWSQDDEGGFHFYGHEELGADLASQRLRQLRFGRSEQELVADVIRAHMRLSSLASAERVTGRAAYRFFRDLEEVGVGTVLLSLADHLATWGAQLAEPRWRRRLQVADALLRYYYERHPETLGLSPLLTGTDLMAELGLSEGPLVGKLLESVREAQAAGEVATREEALALATRAARAASDRSGSGKGRADL
ncbi:MAG: HD domain-containing protein [Anaerolineales bacterium]|nr:HD domain-containing protein [Anaerolineales bacterium]